ncbi:DUF998 domain-containing protein [Lacticaseibacillus zhaodongensis]|uniref:DUF998 domain-containing protein n=1 Tax=Lacticaseibacillus zhaodongensis TaxID=2668065 RepID=UPI001E39DB14|nr:DUF998 domain-containing protein [Lacticaseibacillus zhaodongensis]
MAKETKTMHIELPEEVCTQLGIDDKTDMQMVVKNDKLIIQPRPAERLSSRRLFLVWALGAALLESLAAVIYWYYIRLRSIPLTGSVSIASFVIGFGVVSGTLLFAGFFIKSRNEDTERFSPRIYWRNFPVILFSFALMLGLALLGLFWLLGTLFPGIAFDFLTASLIFLTLTFIANALMTAAAITINSTTLSYLLGAVTVTGAIIAMASNGNRRWWQHNLSFLGTNMASNAWQFNMTLIVTALLMIALIDYLFVALSERYPRNWRLWIIRILLSLVAIDVGLVGIFPNNAASHFLHDQAAGMLVLLLAALIVGIKWLLPDVTPEFLAVSYIIAAILVIMNFGFRWFRYPSLTSFEIQAFVLAFGWLLLLFTRLQALMLKGTAAWPVTIHQQK